MPVTCPKQILGKHSAFSPHCQLRDKQTYVLGLDSGKELDTDTVRQGTRGGDGLQGDRCRGVALLALDLIKVS